MLVDKKVDSRDKAGNILEYRRNHSYEILVILFISDWCKTKEYNFGNNTKITLQNI
jgi:hypothetical protein